MMALLEDEIASAGGAIPFRRYMELALYAPGLGYYVAGAAKFGAPGDFVTAPEISPLFGRLLAAPCAQVLEQLGGGELLEFGAGSGAMAVQVLAQLETLGRLPDRYAIVEPSPELRQRQRQALVRQTPHLLGLVEWLERLPEDFHGVMLANEVLDAMPVTLFRKTKSSVESLWVTLENGRLGERWRPASAHTRQAVEAIEAEVGVLATGYCSEFNPSLAPWLRAVAHAMSQGALLLIDYGHPRHHYYHPQRHMGTLRCHFRHQAHDDPLLLPGLQDITAHVDFTAVAEAGEQVGLSLLGYATQARFLIDCGLERLLADSHPDEYLTLAQGVKQLVSPNGMGEQFKVMALGKGIEGGLKGFSNH